MLSINRVRKAATAVARELRDQEDEVIGSPSSEKAVVEFSGYWLKRMKEILPDLNNATEPEDVAAIGVELLFKLQGRDPQVQVGDDIQVFSIWKNPKR